MPAWTPPERPPRSGDYAPFWRLAAALTEVRVFRLRIMGRSGWIKLLDTLGKPLGVELSGFDAFTWNGTVHLAERLFGTRAGYLVLRHEAVHLLDQQRLGPLPFIIAYLLLPLPAVITLRALFEWRGYRETLRAYRERSPKLARRRAEKLVRQFASGRYLFMWPFRRAVEGWIERELARLESSGGRAPRGLEELERLTAAAPQGEGGDSLPGPPSIID
ncbi:MAG: hypothetical protein GF399_10360 [Candidatus Coatesbacteria bacterium]|nr:hypothetical protein [Candidatus Coatesbacteria bacterium]